MGFWEKLNKTLTGHGPSSLGKALPQPDDRGFDPFHHVGLHAGLQHHVKEAESHFGQAVLAQARGDQVHSAGRMKLYEHHVGMADKYRKAMLAHSNLASKDRTLPAKSAPVQGPKPHPMDSRLDQGKKE